MIKHWAMTSYHFSKIDFNGALVPKSSNLSATKHFQTDSSGILDELSIVNLFIGPNNSGKSRFLRTLFRFDRNFKASLKGYDYSKEIEEIDKIEPKLLNVLRSYPHFLEHPSQPITIEVVRNNFSFYRATRDWLKSDLKERDSFGEFFTKMLSSDLSEAAISEAIRRHEQGPLRYSQAAQNAYRIEVKPVITEIIENLKAIAKMAPNQKTIPGKPIYIPILRGLRSFGSDFNARIKEATKNEYFVNSGEPVNHFNNDSISNGHNLYDRMSQLLLNSSTSRRKLMEYEEFLSREFFNKQIVHISPNTEDRYIHIKLGDQTDLPIHSLGDGMQTLITITFEAFFSDTSCMFFVEEPETYLHPAMQRTLIEVIYRNHNLRRHQWFMTTHSNHLLDMTLDYSYISVFNFNKAEGNKFEVKKINQFNTEIGLKSLGVLPSSVYRINSAIWVEGITDRKYIREILKKYMAEDQAKASYKEDIHFGIIEMGGASQVHYNFKQTADPKKINVRNISQKSFILIDGDNVGKRNRVKDLEDHPDKFILSQKEIENILPEKFLKMAVTTIIEQSQLETEDKVISLQNINNIQYSEYSRKTVKIGKYLDSKLGIEYFEDSSGTIKQKDKLCELVVSHMANENIDWSLDNDCKEIAEKLYSFIEGANS